MPAGYAHPLYGQSLAEFGAPLILPGSRGQLLERPIGRSTRHDAMGPYPLFCCADWRALASDLNGLKQRLVSVVLVADPFGDYDAALLESCFDRVNPFKTHYVIDLEQPGRRGSAHHRYYADRALRDVTVEVSERPAQMLAEWVGLYGQLIERHGIRGIQAFSHLSFRKQLEVPGLVSLRATDRSGECVGAHLWFMQGEVAYSHLAAAGERGYRCGCSYALHSAAIDYFRGRVRWLDLGGGAGNIDAQDGLTRFKAGWSNATRTAFLCGRILDPASYRELSSGVMDRTAFFPAYRYAEAG
jgi:hypothetical protein